MRRATAIARAVGLRPWRAKTDLVAYQEARLRRLVRHAYAHVPYYRELFDRHGVAPERIRTLADLERVPISAKADLRSQPPDRIIASGYDPERLLRAQTTGSTGEPFVLHRTWMEQRTQHLFRLRTRRHFGQRLGDRFVNIAAVRARHPADTKTIGRMLRAAGIERRYQLDVGQPPDLLVRDLARLRPDIVSAYPSVLAGLGDRLERSGRAEVRPRFLVAGAEVLTAARRRQIEATWKVPVFEVYACHEMNLLAWQCRKTGLLHVCDDSLVLEILRDGRPAAAGERGEVVVTSLHNYAMPFIRYRIGDIAARAGGTCRCGRPFSTIAAVQGRMLDFFRTPGGRLVHPYEILSGMQDDAFRWIRQYQLVQEAEDRIRFRIVPGPEFAPERLAEFAQSAIRVLGPGVAFRTELVGRIEPGPGGKHHLARSLVPGGGEGSAWLHSEPVR